MKKHIFIILPAIFIVACAGSPYQTSRMSPDQLQNIPDHQLLRTIKSPTSRNLTVLFEAKRRGWLTDREVNLIDDKKIAIGISEKALIISWGKPFRINKSVGTFGVHKQFIYGYHSRYSSPTYVYVKNGFVTGWQKSN